VRRHDRQANDIAGSGTSLLHALLPPTAVAALLFIGCAGRLVYTQAPVSQNAEVAVSLEGRGEHRVLVRRQASSPPWNTLLLRNAGGAPLKGVQLWGLGGMDLIELDAATAETRLQPFALLPGEQLVVTSTGVAGTSSRLLTGTLAWQWPPTDAPSGWPGGTRNARRREDGAIELNPRGDQAWVELSLEAPIALKGMRVAWEAEGPADALAPWVSSDGKTWMKIAPPRRVDLQRPMELGDMAAGHRRVALRLACAGSATGGGPLILRRLRLEREIEAPGGLRLWPAGLSEARLAFRAPSDGRLTLRLMGL
jgi:hypothetical protein